MAPHCSILAGRISWTEEHGGLQSTVCKSRTRLSIWAHKNWQPDTLGPLAFSDGPHSVECVSPKGPLTFWDKLCSAFGICSFLNKPAVTLLWLTVEFFPAWNQGPTLGGQSQGLTQVLGYDSPPMPLFFLQQYERNEHNFKKLLMHWEKENIVAL